MKHDLRTLTLFLVTLLLCTFTRARGQSLPVSEAHTIFITTNLADNQAYIAIGKVLTEQSILFSVTSDGILISSQGNTFTDNQDAIFVGQLTVTGGLVKLTGQMRTPSKANSNDPSDSKVVPIGYQKSKTSVSKAGFIYMNELAKKLKPVLHGVIRYKAQKGTMS
ncbi:hypothetical protein [Spirosoma migulaei]